MRASVTFFLLCEGSSDEPLSEHIGSLISRLGVRDVVGYPRSGPGSVLDKIRSLRDEGAPFDFIAVHRDADSPNPVPRIEEVENALALTGLRGCAVVPVQMTEAWLLVDEAAIRAAVGVPGGRQPLGLPKLREIESTSDPKAILKAAILIASGTAGRRRKKAATQWATYRRLLLERLDIDGPVAALASWQGLVERVESAVRSLDVAEIGGFS